MVPASTPGLESARDALAAAETQQAYWAAHYAEFLQRYPEQFVAVHDGAVVATSPDLAQLLRALERRGLEPRRVWVRLITADAHRLAH